MSGVESVTAAGGVVYKQHKNGELDVVLIFRRGVWDLPKGKLEEGESVRECAVREVAEEIGLSSLPEITHRLANTYHEYSQEDTQYGKTTHWFAMKLSGEIVSDFDPETEEGIEKVAWKELSEATELVGYENLAEVLTSFEQSVRAK